MTACGGKGTDSAVPYAGSGNDTFDGSGSMATMNAPSNSYGTIGFGNVDIVSSTGGFDQALVSSIVYALTRTGTWH